jgi:hypothetical protein
MQTHRKSYSHTIRPTKPSTLPNIVSNKVLIPFFGIFFYIFCTMEKEHQIFGIRAIIEAQLVAVDKVYIKKQVAN